ncbi:YczE/YyaS/YitT family protein [Sinomonas susongensis]|uniref:membrane protein YczE n=1 Tax=Sinomonas susongensis TaxID=1324851 RepID=UPI001BB2867A|nr:hypothetical protein [Sinomonas susongensis]
MQLHRFLRSQRLPVRLVRLFSGLFAYGIAIAFILRAGLGASPWDVLGQGVARALGVSFGTATIVISLAVLVLWIPLRQRPGWGTVSNAALVGVFADLGLAWIPAATVLPVWWPLAEGLFLAVGLALLALASALYIGAGLGPGPRDGLMTGLVARTGWPVWAVRSGIELSATGCGWLLGGTVGIGTAVFALTIGPLIQLALRLLAVDLATPPVARSAAEELPLSGGAGR